MADIKISDLASNTAVATGDLIPCVDVSDTAQGPAGSTKKMTVAQLKTGLGLPDQAFTAATGLTAAGTAQGDALALTAETNNVTTTASGTGVRLAAYVQAGFAQRVRNAGANTLNIYPPSGCSINALSANAAYTLFSGGTAVLYWVSSTLLVAFSIDVGVASIDSSGTPNGMSWTGDQVLRLHPADATNGGVIVAADQTFPTGRRQFNVTGSNTTLATQSTNEVRVANTGTGDAVVKFLTNGTARAQIRADNGGTFNFETTAHQFHNVGSGTVYTWAVNGTVTARLNSSGLYLGGNVDSTLPLTVNGNGQLSGNFTPAANGGGSIGTTALRWGDVWCTDGAFNGSDGRQKKDVKQAPLGLDFVRALKPVSWKWKQVHKATRLVEVYADAKERAEAQANGLPTQREEHEYREGRRQHHGFIAQDVGELVEQMGADFAGYAYDEATDTYSLRYTEFIAPLTRSVQELAAENDDLKARVAKLEELVARLVK